MDDSELNEHAILDWVNTFELENQIANLADLNDGNVLAKILNEISPESFDVDALNKETNGNWALAAGNLRKLLRMLEEYFTEVLQKKIDMSNVDVNSIAKTNDIDSLLNLLELVVGAAVLCEDKAKFIGNIFQLNHNSQSVLKGLIEQVLNRAEDLGGEEDGDEEGLEEYEVEGAGASGVSAESASGGQQQLSEEEAVRNNEMLTHLQAERQRLLTEVAALQTANEGYNAEVSKLREKVIVKDSERSALEGSDRHALQQLETSHNRMAVELDEVKRELDIKISEHHTLTSELKLSSMRLEASKELQAKLEMETHQLADELDIARDKASKLAKAEQTIEKYSKKLEEMVTLKKQNKDLNDKLDTYLDQIHDLESANKGLATMNRMVESYKNKAVELEREKFEAISSAQMKEFAVTQLQSELDALQQSKQFLEDELTSVKNNLQQVLDAQEELKASPVRNRTASQAAAEGSSDIYETDTIPNLKEKVRKLERQLSQQGGNGSGDADAGSESAGDIALLTEELADANRIRKEREEALFAAKRQVTEAQQEIVKLQRQMADNEKHSSAAVSLKEATQKLGETSNTVRLLEERLKEKETLINKLEQDKGKLESYTKRSLATFKEKYMAVLQQMKEEKKDLENKVRICLEKSEANQVNWHREERLVSSAMFEIGVRIMDRKIQSNLNDNIHATAAANSNNATFMSVQREAHNKTNPADPSLAAVGAGVERKLFPAAGPNSPL